MILIFVTFENKRDAKKAAHYLIDNKLASCVEIYPVQSFYIWQGKKLTPDEIGSIIKTEDGYFEKVKDALEKILPYEIPQIIEVKASNVNASYIGWVKNSLQKVNKKPK